MVSSQLKSTILLSLSLVALAGAQLPSWTKTDIYKGCGEATKICYGDTASCIQDQNCTYVVTAVENRTHYVAEIQNNCDGKKDHGVFFGVGATALTRKDSQSVFTCRPKFQDFRFVILWSGDEKCPTGGETIKKWGFLEKNKLMHECTDSPNVTNLEEFVTNQMMVHSGEIPHQLIADKKYEAKDNGVFFTNADADGNSGTTLNYGLALMLTSLSAILSYNAL